MSYKIAMRKSTLVPLLTIVCFFATFWCGAPTAHAGEVIHLLDGKLTFDLGEGFVPDKEKKKPDKQSIADFKARKGDAWGGVMRGTHGLQPDGLNNYITRKVADYTKGLSWLPHLVWLKKEIVTIDGRPWADLRYIGQRENAKDPLDGLLYTRIFATSYGGQLLEFTLTSNTDPERATKVQIDGIIESVKLSD